MYQFDNKKVYKKLNILLNKRYLYIMRHILPVFRTDAWALYLKGFDVVSKEASNNRIYILKLDKKIPYEYFDDNKKYGLYLNDEETLKINNFEKNQKNTFIACGISLVLGFLLLGVTYFIENSYIANSGIIFTVFGFLLLLNIAFNYLLKNNFIKGLYIKYGIKNGL